MFLSAAEGEAARVASLISLNTDEEHTEKRAIENRKVSVTSRSGLGSVCPVDGCRRGRLGVAEKDQSVRSRWLLREIIRTTHNDKSQLNN